MSRSYYVIELSARWLTVLLVALALLMVLAFGLGYGAARSIKGNDPSPAVVGPAATPEIEEEVIPDPTPGLITPTPTPKPMPPTALPPTPPAPTRTPAEEPKPTATPRPAAEPVSGFWVQVLASSKDASITDARRKLVGLGFDLDHQKVVRSTVAGGNELIKLRVGPFPDRASADRVLQRMRAADFPDAWVVAPQ